jgi:alkylation response protein AidB-like acyl-CoA dehydrogenase
MDVSLSEEQFFLRDTIADVVARSAPLVSVRRWLGEDDLGTPDELAVALGWTGLGLPEELGGQGGGVEELAILGEQLGYGAVPWDRTLAACVAGPLLAAAGDAGRTLAAETAAGGRHAVLCIRGDELGAAPTAAAPSGDRLSVRVPYVVGGRSADELIVPVAASGDRVDLLAVAADSPGATIVPRRLVDRSRDLATVELDGCAIRSLGTVPVDSLQRAADLAALLVCADTLGAISRLLELTTLYVGERQQFGVPVGSFQAVKHAAAQMLVDVEGVRSAVQYAAWALGAEEAEAGLQASVAKSFAADAGTRVADRALFLHGAIGYTWEHDLQFLFKRAKSGALLFGSAQAHRERICGDLGLAPSIDPRSHARRPA